MRDARYPFGVDAGEEVNRQRKLDDLKKDLVSWANELAEGAPGDFTAQLSLAQEAAMHESEPAVLKNYLEYQAAKASGSKKKPGWSHRGLYKTAVKHIEFICEACGEDSLLRSRAIALYLGYVRRSYMALTKLRGGKRQ